MKNLIQTKWSIYNLAVFINVRDILYIYKYTYNIANYT